MPAFQSYGMYKFDVYPLAEWIAWEHPGRTPKVYVKVQSFRVCLDLQGARPMPTTCELMMGENLSRSVPLFDTLMPPPSSDRRGAWGALFVLVVLCVF